MLKSSRILVYNKKKSGQGFLIAPGQVTTYRADEQEPWEYTWIEFDGLRAHEALNLAGISGQNPVYSPASIKAGQLLQDQIRLSFFRQIKTPHLSDRILSDNWGVVHSGRTLFFYYDSSFSTRSIRYPTPT